MTPVHNVVLLNPNTDRKATAAMLDAARRHAPKSMSIDGVTAAVGPVMIIDPIQLTAASDEVARMASGLASYQGVIVAAFGDPGVEDLRAKLPVPIVGIGQASMLAAAVGGRRFAVATSTPDLAPSIVAMARSLHLFDRFTGVFLTRNGPLVLRANPQALQIELLEAAHEAMHGGAEAIVVGGGPFVAAAVGLEEALEIDVIQPIPAAIAEMHRQLNAPS